MKCPDPQCGTENDEAANFCRGCGARLAADDRPSEESDRQCPACGRDVPASARFCGKCGCPIPDGPAETIEVMIEPRRAAETEAAASGANAPPAVEEAAPDAPIAGAVHGDLPADGGRGGVGPSLFVISLAAAVVVAGILGAWLWLGQPAPAAQPLAPTPAPRAALPAPAEAATTTPPASGAAIVTVPAAGEPATGEPFRSLLTPEAPAQAEAARADDEAARAKAERARKRREARLAREAAQREARDAALKTAEPAPPPPPNSVKELCAGEASFLGRNGCEARLCQGREWMFTPYCMQRRQLEEQKRQGMFGSSD